MELYGIRRNLCLNMVYVQKIIIQKYYLHFKLILKSLVMKLLIIICRELEDENEIIDDNI